MMPARSRPHPAPGRRLGSGTILLGLLAAAWLLTGLAATPARAVAAPTGSPGSVSLVFSEIYAPVGGDPAAQWFELHNTQPAFDYPLNGLVLATSSHRATLQTTAVISAEGYVLFVFTPDAVDRGAVHPLAGALVVVVPDLQGLNPAADALILYTPDGALVMDQVNWGKPDPNWPNYRSDFWDPGLGALEASSGAQRTWGRTPADQDTNLPRPPAGDWTIHEMASPGGRVPPIRPTPFLNDWTNVAGGLGSLLLWAAFIIIAVIAYRFEQLRDTRTYWQLLLLAPSGLLFYTVVVILGFSQPGAALTNDQKWLSFPVLAISALFCLLAVGIFRRVARSLLEGD